MRSEDISEIMGAAQLMFVDIGELQNTDINDGKSKTNGKVSMLNAWKDFLNSFEMIPERVKHINTGQVGDNSMIQNIPDVEIINKSGENMIQQDAEKIYSCGECNFQTRHNSSHLKYHIRSKHEGIRYPCDQCDYKATDKGNLMKHIKSIHEGIRYPCGQCTHKAISKGYLKMHIEFVDV